MKRKESTISESDNVWKAGCCWDVKLMIKMTISLLNLVGCEKSVNEG